MGMSQVCVLMQQALTSIKTARCKALRHLLRLFDLRLIRLLNLFFK